MLVLPVDFELETRAVYAEADRLRLGRSPEELADRHRELRAAWSTSAPEGGADVRVAGELFRNDLQQAALALCPEIAAALSEARLAGADLELVSGSGPTVVGLFLGDRRGRQDPGGDRRGSEDAVRAGEASPAGESGRPPARLAPHRLVRRAPAAVSARPVEAGFGQPAALRRGENP
jgi:4-diphosphocytidyl-2-C-methyl-D-erythritol kinase